MSLTSKQIEELRAYAADRKGELAKLINDAADTIELLSAKLHASQMERSSQYYHGGWIPVGERLPEVHESGNSFSGIYMQSVPVLVYGICEGEKNAQFHVVTYCDDLDGTTYWSTELDALTITKVTAWMPLPELYREEGEQNGKA